jgi:hypothetical protein
MINDGMDFSEKEVKMLNPTIMGVIHNLKSYRQNAESILV